MPFDDIALLTLVLCSVTVAVIASVCPSEACKCLRHANLRKCLAIVRETKSVPGGVALIALFVVAMIGVVYVPLDLLSRLLSQ